MNYRSKAQVQAFLIKDVQVTVESISKATAILTLDGMDSVSVVYGSGESMAIFGEKGVGFVRSGDYWINEPYLSFTGIWHDNWKAVSADRFLAEFEAI